jgi:glycine betaine catabolism B
MYRLISIALTLLWVMAFLLSLTGTLAHSPLAFIASIITLVATTYLASLLFGALFGVRIHSESSYITAFILFFIFTPTSELSGLLALGLTGSIAAASKFILAYRGRHIFNPAAIAALIISLTGLEFASWWVATPPLLPATLLLAILILYKTRRLLIGAVFVSLASLIIVGMMLSYGTELGESLTLLASWPLLFFAGFMLSEPLTLPQKRWQQITEAVIVGVLFAVPIHIGDFATNPAVALLVGNLIAFVLSKRESITLKLKKSKKITPTSYEFTFASDRALRFEAGQYIELTLPHKGKDMRGIRRTFSLTSAPEDTDVKLAVKFYDPSSTFKRSLKALPEESLMSATGVNGDFTLPKDPKVPLLYVAGGIGITPFISHLRHLQHTKEKRDITLIYAASSDEEIAYRQVLEASGVAVYILTPEKNHSVHPASTWRYMQAQYLTKQLLLEIAPDIATRHVYISGPPALVDSVKRISKQAQAKKIRTDYFIGY